MSASKPAMKRTRQNAAAAATTLVRTESVAAADLNAFVEEKNRRTATSQVPPSTTTLTQTTLTTTKTPQHPKGHKVRELAEVWKTMDSQAYLRLTDTLVLNDVWVQPIAAEPANGPFATVTFRQIIDAPHLKMRFATSKMSTDDLLKILYLNDCMQWDMLGSPHVAYGDWLNEKSAVCVKARGLDEGSNRAKLCNYIITEDHDFTFFPTFLKGVGIFFRKICYHSYKLGEKVDGEKMVNPAMIKCSSANGKFEYVLEARIFTIPAELFDEQPPQILSEELPETQVM